jgi:hypothetical protein
MALGLAAASALAATVSARPPDPRLLSSGAYKYASDRAGLDQQALLEAGTLLFNREAEAGTITVRRAAGITSLAIDGYGRRRFAHAAPLARAVAHARRAAPPPSSARQRRDRLGGAAHDLESLDVIELSPAVVSIRALQARPSTVVGIPLNLIVGDGRTHRADATAADVIVSEPSNPWMAGIASLYTQEFFRLVRDRLIDGGVFCQWAHTYDIDEADVQSIVATLRTVFPHASAWVVGGGDLLLLGSLVPLDGGLAALATRPTAPRVRDDLASVHASRPLALTSLIAADTRGLDAFAAGAGRQTDDRARLEFTALPRRRTRPRAISGPRRPSRPAPAGFDEATAADPVRSRMLLPPALHSVPLPMPPGRRAGARPDDAVERLIDAAAASNVLTTRCGP